MKIKNQKAIKNIAFKQFKANKIRNRFAIIAIALTTILFTSLFTIGFGLMKSMEQNTMRQVGGSSHGGFKYLTQEEYDVLSRHPLIKDINFSIVLASAENHNLRSRPTEIRYGDELVASWYFAAPSTGRMPEAYNEVALDTIILDLLGLPHEIGQTISLEFSVNDEVKMQDFILTGFWEGDKVIPASMIWISKPFLDEHLSKMPITNDAILGTISADVFFKNSIGIDKKLEKVITDSGYDLNDIRYGVNWAYTSSTAPDPMIIGSSVAALMLVMFCGYLIIYNIFYISISKDIRFYGLLKTIGTTSSQIKTMVMKQAMRLCCVAIPLGLIIGYAVGVVFLPMIVASTTSSQIAVSFNPLIFIGSAIFALLTVLISTKKPMKLASKVSPIEAIRYVENDESSNKKSKKGRKGANLFKMAHANVFRNHKKTWIVTLSLSLSLIILNGTYTFVSGFDMDKYLSQRIVTDFTIADTGYFNVNIGYNGQLTLTDDFLSELHNQSNIEAIGSIRFSEFNHPLDEVGYQNFQKLYDEFKSSMLEFMLEFVEQDLENKELLTHLYGIDDFILNLLNVTNGDLDLEKFKSGDYIIVSTYVESGEGTYYNVGEKVTLSYPDGSHKTYEVLALATIPHNLGVRHGHATSPDFYLPMTEYTTHINNSAPMLVTLNVADDHETTIESFLDHHPEVKNGNLNYDSKAKLVAEFTSMQQMFETVGYSLSFIIAIIGIVNFVNTMLTSVLTRRQELAMLQSIGMTKKQLNKMLIFEGAIYAGLTIIFVCTIGILVSSGLVMALASGMGYFSYRFTILPIMMCVPILILISLVVPTICYRLASKDSIIERLRVE